MEGSTKRKITRVGIDSAGSIEDSVAVERKLNISLNGRQAVSLFCTPLMVQELVVGFLMTEGIAERICTERMSVTYGDEINVDVPVEGEVRLEGGIVTSGCAGGVSFGGGKGKTPGDFEINRDELLDLFGRFGRLSALYPETGCVHSAAIASRSEILYFAEDIGRHNAVDKTIGAALLDGEDLSVKALLTSGRLSSEIVNKCSRWGIPLLASRAAPTDLAVEIAGRKGLTVVGFLRGRRMNVYTRPDRIKYRPSCV